MDHEIVLAVIFTTLIILLLIAGVAITIFIANKQRLQQEMKVAQMEVDYEKELRKAGNEVQEQVMTNVARELHDNIGQLLTLMHLQIEQRRIDKPELQETLQPVKDTLATTIQEVRMLGRSLNSDLLEQNGLLQTLQMEVNRISQLNHLKVEWQHDNTEPVLSRDQKLMVFRIFQELLNNTLKHASAAHLYITLDGKDTFRLTLKDDGKGFDPNKTMASGSGAGLKNIYKRAAMATLNCNITSSPGKGSIFTLEQSVS